VAGDVRCHRGAAEQSSVDDVFGVTRPFKFVLLAAVFLPVLVPQARLPVREIRFRRNFCAEARIVLANSLFGEGS
jgi:hypothetical protein